MNSQYVCRETPECNGLINKTETCEKCGKKCQEELDSGEIVVRMTIPEYTLKDIIAIEKENSDLTNETLLNSDRFFMFWQGLIKNMERRQQLQNKMKATVEGAMKRLRLQKDKDIRWGYDPFKKTFVGLKKPKSKIIEEKPNV